MPSTREPSASGIDWKRLERERAAFAQGRDVPVHLPSPESWEDEILYFLLVDRFSDGKEQGGFHPVDPALARSTPRFRLSDRDSKPFGAWFEAGKGWCGGNIAGLRDKLDYLTDLGATALWVSPVLKQRSGADTYHGYAIQDFLDVDPRFGTREDLRELVAAAHERGIRVVLDIVLNHAGDVFAYADDREYKYWNGQAWPVDGFRNGAAAKPGSLGPSGAFGPDDAVWPVELQDASAWTRKGRIQDWDALPEYLDGDFCSLKNIEHGSSEPGVPDWDYLKRIRTFQARPSISALIEVYKHWIAYADLDGYRIDTVMHMEPGAVRLFCNSIHEYAQTLGKERFFLVGEVTGGRGRAVDVVNATGLDAALGIDDIQDKMEFLAKGWRNPGNPDSDAQEGYFDLFSNSVVDGLPSHRWFGGHVLTQFKDHDTVGVDHKFRFCGPEGSYPHLRAAFALDLLTSGIPCIYYGEEQAFNGCDRRTDTNSYSDVFLRECMFGGPFGSFQSHDRHFFDDSHEIFRFVHDLAALRKDHRCLRRGRQYLRQVATDPSDFFYPRMVGGQLRFVVAWSRIFSGEEIVVAINTDPDRDLEVWITVDSSLHPAGSILRTLLTTGDSSPDLAVQDVGRRAVKVRVPKAGVVALG